MSDIGYMIGEHGPKVFIVVILVGLVMYIVGQNNKNRGDGPDGQGGNNRGRHNNTGGGYGNNSGGGYGNNNTGGGYGNNSGGGYGNNNNNNGI